MTRSIMYTYFIITKQNYKIIDRAISADFDKYITGLRNSLYFNDAETYKRAAEKLSGGSASKEITVFGNRSGYLANRKTKYSPV